MSDEASDTVPVDDAAELPVEDSLESSGDAPDSDSALDDPSSGLKDVPFRVMHLESVLYDLTDPSPMVHLMEAEAPYRYLVIPVALADAIAIHHAHGAIEGRRPATHELMSSVMARLQSEVIAARIVRYEAGVFYAELDLMTPKGREVFDCRTSDALSLALRQRVPAPILCSEDVLEAYYT